MVICRAIMLGVALCLCACAEPKLPLSDMSVIKAVDGSTDGMDIYAVRRAAGETVPNLRGNQIVEIRTYLPRINDFGNEVPGQEIAGANCDVILDNFRASVRTPGGVHVPLYGHVTAPMSLECQMAGFHKAVAIATPYDKTIADRRAATAGAGAAGGILGAVLTVAIVEGINAASDVTTHQFHYRMPQILLRKNGTAPAPSAPATAVAPRATGQAATVSPSTADTVPATTTPAVTQPSQPSQPPPRNRAKRQAQEDNTCTPWCP